MVLEEEGTSVKYCRKMQTSKEPWKPMVGHGLRWEGIRYESQFGHSTGQKEP